MPAQTENSITGGWSEAPTADENKLLQSLNEGWTLYEEAYTTIDELRQHTPAQLETRLNGDVSTEGQEMLSGFAINFENTYGDKYSPNAKGQVEEFTYVDADGKPTKTFSNITYGDGAVSSFTTGGDTWTAADDGSWVNQKGDKQDFGAVSFDKNGMNSTGMDAANLQVPTRTFKNTAGDSYQKNADGRIAHYSYCDESGNEVMSYSNIQYDANGNVIAFTESSGDEWRKQPANPNSPWIEDRDGGGWMTSNAKDGSTGRSPTALGDVSFDESGIHSTGASSLQRLYLPLYQATRREAISNELKSVAERLRQ